MRVLFWNVNSLGVRYDRLIGVLERHDPDVVCLQETKSEDARFPEKALQQKGYHCAYWGQKSYNGVAILSKAPLQDVRMGFDGDPVPEEARTIAATVPTVDGPGLRIWDLYVVNGQAKDSPKFATKMQWLDALRAAVEADRNATGLPTLLVGDWNITPSDLDVHDPEKWRGQIHATPEERGHLQAFLDGGFHDLQRRFDEGPGPWTWWDYRFQAFRHGWGIRIDLALGDDRVAEATTSVRVDKDERRQPTHPSKPSDHAPVIVDLAWESVVDPPRVEKPTVATTLGAFE